MLSVTGCSLSLTKRDKARQQGHSISVLSPHAALLNYARSVRRQRETKVRRFTVQCELRRRRRSLSARGIPRRIWTWWGPGGSWSSHGNNPFRGCGAGCIWTETGAPAGQEPASSRSRSAPPSGVPRKERTEMQREDVVICCGFKKK